MILDKLNILNMNDGAFSMHYSDTKNNYEVLESYSPIDTTLIAKVKSATSKDSDFLFNIMEQSQKPWQAIPAPKRAELIKKFIIEIKKKKKYLLYQ